MVIIEKSGNFVTWESKMTIVEETDNKIVVKFDGETHTLLNALRKIAMQLDGVEKATYYIDHPLKMNAYFILETKKGKAREKLIEAFEKLIQELEKFKEEYYKQIK